MVFGCLVLFESLCGFRLHQIAVGVGVIGYYLGFVVEGFFEIVILKAEDNQFGTSLVGSCSSRLSGQGGSACLHASCHRGFDGGLLLLGSQLLEDFFGGIFHHQGKCFLGSVHEVVKLRLGRPYQGHIASHGQDVGHLGHHGIALSGHIAALEQHKLGVVGNSCRYLRQSFDECRTCRGIGKLAERRYRHVDGYAYGHLVGSGFCPHRLGCHDSTAIVLVLVFVAAA